MHAHGQKVTSLVNERRLERKGMWFNRGLLLFGSERSWVHIQGLLEQRLDSMPNSHKKLSVQLRQLREE